MSEFGFQSGVLIGQSGLNYMGSWNAFTNNPNLLEYSPQNGDYWVVSVAGTTNLDGTTDWQVGDWAIFNGSIFQKIDNHDVQAYNTIQNQGVSLPQQSVIDFQGNGVVATDSTGKTIVTISKTNLYSATFFDTTTQNNGGATTANQVAINSTQNANGFTLSGNRINVLNTAVYFLSVNLQLAFTGGASNYNVTVWYTIDDVIVPNSAFTFTTSSAQNDQTLATITDTISINAGSFIKVYWWSQATGMKLLTTAGGSNPTRPLSPSVNFNIFNIG
jgi:hypothetical protein